MLIVRFVIFTQNMLPAALPGGAGWPSISLNPLGLVKARTGLVPLNFCLRSECAYDIFYKKTKSS